MSQSVDTERYEQYHAAKQLLATYGIATIAEVDLKTLNLSLANMIRRNCALEKALSNLLGEFENIPDGEIVNVDEARAVMKETEIPNDEPTE